MQHLRFILPNGRYRPWLLAVLCCWLAVCARAAPVKFDLPAQPAAAALAAFAKQAGVEVLFSFTDLKDKESTAVVGLFEPAEAIERLLRGTGFSAQRNAAGKFIVIRAPRQAGEIRGSVVAHDDGQLVAGATVRLADAAWAVRTNAEGEFALREVPAGAQTLVVSAEGFLTMRVAGLEIRPAQRTELKAVRLAAADNGALQLAEMVIDASDLDSGLGSALLALRTMVVTPSRFGIEEERGTVAAMLTENDLLALPQLGEDLYRAISHLPGLAADDLTARFWVRGAPHDQVLARFDGVDLIEPFHLKDTDGSLSILDLETISRLDLYTGGFGAEFGDRLAGVLTMETDCHVRAAPRTTLGLSLTGGHVASRGQTPDGRSHWLVSVRSGYPDLALGKLGGDNIREIRPRYHDAMAKWETNLTPDQVVSVHALHAGDRMNFRDANGSVLTSSYGSDYLWARWQGSFGRFTGEAALSYTEVDWRRDGDGLINRILPLQVHERRELKSFGLRQDWTASLSDRVLLRGGAELKSGTTDYDYHSLRDFFVVQNGTSRIDHLTRDARVQPDGRSVGAYLSVRMQPVPELTLEPGVRYDGDNYAQDRDVSPRFSAAWHFGRSTLRAAWGVYAQAQGLHQLQVQDGDSAFGRAERAEHSVLSLEHQLRTGLKLRIEAYQRDVTHLRPHWENVIDMTDALPEVDGDRVRIDATRQRATGVELIAERRTSGKFAWSASYACARTEETLAGGLVIPRMRDQRHTLYLDATYTPNPRWQFSAAWQYHTGWPTTGQDFTLVPLNGGLATISNLGPLYGLRLPAYQRLDFRVQRRIDLKQGTLRVYLDVFNALGRRNTINFNYDLNLDAGNRLVVTRKNGDALFPLLPSVGAVWDF